jgi:hypothetical protein
VADCPPHTWLQAQLRFAPSRPALESAPWLGPSGARSWYQNGEAVQAEQFRGQWVQYQLALGAHNGCGTPRVREVSIQYRGE